jgi:hypothetical protein
MRLPAEFATIVNELPLSRSVPLTETERIAALGKASMSGPRAGVTSSEKLAR